MTPSPTSAHTSANRVPLRMQMLDSPSTGHLGGVWWPQSRDLQVEAADLVDHFPDQVGHIDRLLISRPDWDNAVFDGHGGRRIHARRGPVKVGSFPSADTQLMILLLATGRRVSLKVIASATDPVEAERQFQVLRDGEFSGAKVEAAQARSHTEGSQSWM
jgi:hypothetical protein